MSSYTEAARLAPSGANIFDPAVYSQVSAQGTLGSRYIGTFEVDLYQYPPAFLILPAAAEKAGLDFFTVRTVWFVIQMVVLLGGLIVTATWIGGTRGAAAAMCIPLIFLAPTTRVALQAGQFPIDRVSAGGSRDDRVAFAITLHERVTGRFTKRPYTDRWTRPWLLRRQQDLPGRAWDRAPDAAAVEGCRSNGRRRRRRHRARAAGGRPKPFVDFVYYQLPRIDSGQAFFWIEHADMAPVNQSVYGLVTKLRALGVPGTTAAAANLASSVYAVLLMVVAVIGARRLQRLTQASADPSLIRLRHAQLWLGLLSLASFRSPFVPDAYGLVGTLWLLTLIAAERQRLYEWGALVAAGAAFSIVLDGGLVPTPVPLWMTLGSLAIQLAAYSINFFVVLTSGRKSIERANAVPRPRHAKAIV